MMKDLLFVVYTVLIPAIPLWGAGHYKRSKDKKRRTMCFVLFGVQTLISLGCILAWFGYV